MYQELYYICEAFFGKAELSYDEWLEEVEELVQRRVEEEVQKKIAGQFIRDRLVEE